MTGDSFTKISISVPLCFEYGKNTSEREHERHGFLVKAKFSPQIIYVQLHFEAELSWWSSGKQFVYHEKHVVHILPTRL
jgi:hypothetical protein